ncbi:hypothetical protein CDAR_613011 [Caerostris darwini]|uniref:Uncharacterized protein n=1 Tax=Caerostris darwini TaxID=1538125 RepID=A0AAV4UEW3_9ARAC|nr:hypothetical protein CDAR_613011 [Caerostris darwini]
MDNPLYLDVDILFLFNSILEQKQEQSVLTNFLIPRLNRGTSVQLILPMSGAAPFKITLTILKSRHGNFQFTLPIPLLNKGTPPHYPLSMPIVDIDHSLSL